MPEQEDLNKDQSVTDQDLNSAGSVDQQDLQDQSVTDQNQDVLKDGTTKDKTVKYSELEKATKRAKEAEEARMLAERQLELMQAHQQGQQTGAPQTAPKTSMEQAMQEYNVTSDDLFGDVMVKVLARKDEIDNAVRQQQNAALSNLQFISTHPDVGIVGSVNPSTGQMMTASPELMSICTKKPHLARACATVQGAYNIVMQERRLVELEKNDAANKQHLTRQGIDTATQPLGGSAAGGGGVGEQQEQKLMTREQVDAIQARIDSGEIQ